MCNCVIKTENIKIKAENEILRNELDEANLRIYHLEKENEKLRNTFKYVKKILDNNNNNSSICK